MCNRITMTLPDAATLRALLALEPSPDDDRLFKSRYNVAPTQTHPVIGPQLPPRLSFSSWGLGEQHQLNTRLETLLYKGFDAGVVPCAIPATGFLEWEGPKDNRVPVLFEPRGDDVMLLAGITDGHGFSVITTTPDSVVAPVHDRMPLVLGRREWKPWLQARVPKGIRALIDACAGVTLSARRVSQRINNVNHDDAECLKPYNPDDAGPRQLKLL